MKPLDLRPDDTFGALSAGLRVKPLAPCCGVTCAVPCAVTLERPALRLLKSPLFSLVLLLVCGWSCLAQSPSANLGLFSDQSDIGAILHPGSARFDSGTGSYRVSGSGDNTWFTSDDLHYVWKRVASGDVTLAADIRFVHTGGNPHRKAMLMIRQSLAANSPYVDVALHGVGLTSLQYRNSTGDVTREVRAPVSGPLRVGIAKRGDFFYVYFAKNGGKLQFSGATMRLPMTGPFYVGLGVCSHDKNVVETANFSQVMLKTAPTGTEAAGPLVSTLETVAVASTDRAITYTAAAHFEAPNWLKNGSGFLINENGQLMRVAVPDGGLLRANEAPRLALAPQKIDTGTDTRCNNDHGPSPDGSQIAFSDSSGAGGVSRVSIVPIAGGSPRLLTPDGPSYWHGWSPDGRTIAFTGQRNVGGAEDFDIYTIPAAGGPEKRLTTAKGLDDGPDYSPDGQWIYFNSERTGHMQIWRMHTDGAMQEQVTHDGSNDWFPHISPDGKWMVYLQYGAAVKGHPDGQDVTLQLRSLLDGKTTLLAKLWGGQGTINVPSWSPDSRSVAFVSYAMPPSF